MASKRSPPAAEGGAGRVQAEASVLREDARLLALERYDILDTPEEEAFDRVTRLAQTIFRTPMVTVTLIDGHRQWFKSRRGMTLRETPRAHAFCNETIKRAAPLVVRNALKDETFADNPLVTGAPGIQFYAGAPLVTPDGHPIGTLCVMDRMPRSFDDDELAILVDLAGIVVDELELRRLATVDVLTGALSRRAFRNEAGRTLHLARRHGHEFSLVVFDLDNFKAVNRAHGHAGGDVVLARSVAACGALLRASDVMGRLGGEEFAIALPHTGAEAALGVAERLREAIAAEAHPTNGAAVSVTASFGVASYIQGAADIDALLREATSALYRAKAEGRDRCAAAQRGDDGVDAPARRRVLKGGRILFNRRTSAVDCTIRSLSATGAGLDVSSPAGLPETFELSIEADRIMRNCRIVSLSDRRIEVEFG
ncbi:sensor domain-containing diguanylate cyclase [Hansschlegelia plantiphila]|uniref:GGDEF domain-containing protein n=1 Tax=Hansschlegelia plantiphila TaxID=374655 RepID=A0A9W6J125_9HYPH|nr:sensor domain-containing diguanylate cyclase [Hansschlegelia plantiphila]GLK68407.1 hypothetical protein GCM10008179_20450 [Hansschlegelia plantiphila]